MHACGCSRLEFISRPDQIMTSEAHVRLDAMIERRLRNEPLQYITGEAAFYGRLFHVTPDVLIPRPETEELVERVLTLEDKDLSGGIIDLGTGSGCIPTTLALERRGVECTGIDISKEALVVARENADRLGANVTWLEADMADPSLAEQVYGPMSVLISNPPYIPDSELNEMQPEVRDHEPHMALFSGLDALQFYRVIAGQSRLLLVDGGHVFVEIHADAGQDVCRLFEEAGLEDVVLHKDMAGRDRIVHARRP